MKSLEVWISRRAQNVLHVRHLPTRFTIRGTKTAGLPACWALERVREDPVRGCTLYRVSLSTATWLMEEAGRVAKAEEALWNGEQFSLARLGAMRRLVQDLSFLMEGQGVI